MAHDTFLGRERYLSLIEKRVKDLKEGYRQNIALIGDELVGKTSLIFEFLKKFYDGNFIVLYLEIRQESLFLFARRFIAVLLYNFLNTSAIPLKEDLDFLIAKSCGYIPRTTDKIKLILQDLDKKKKENVFSELLSLCELIHEETGKYCVVIFDEFLNLEAMAIKKLYAEWSKVLLVQKNTLYVIISSLTYKAKSILAKDLSLLFGNFEIIPLEPLDIFVSEEYLLSQAPRAIGALRNFIINFTGGIPFYLKVVTDALNKSAHQNFITILQELLFDSSGILNQRFSNYLKRLTDVPHSQEYMAILCLIAEGHNKIKDIAHILRKTKKEIDPRIHQLLELDTVRRSGDFLHISDRVFCFWLKFVYKEKLNSLTFDTKHQVELFRHKITDMLHEFIDASNKPFFERMTELLRLFEDEQIMLEKKKLRLNHFREIKPLSFSQGSVKEGLLCRSQDSVWLIGLKEGTINEEDIALFSSECKKYRHKLQRKIIISFKDVDPNSRLRALEEKVTTWNINNVNQLLDLYSKPRIIA
jgi:hypothetical protein